MDAATKLIEAIAKLISALAWPAVAAFAVARLAPSVTAFLSTMSELRLRGGGFEASAVRRLDFDVNSQRLHDFWKPGGKTDRQNAARITECMSELGIPGSVAWLINAADPDDRARVVLRLGLDPDRR